MKRPAKSKPTAYPTLITGIGTLLEEFRRCELLHDGDVLGSGTTHREI
jgi:hypothetical protein